MNWYIPPFFLIELNIPYNSQSHRTDDAKHNFSLDFDLVAAGNVFDFFFKDRLQSDSVVCLCTVESFSSHWCSCLVMF